MAKASQYLQLIDRNGELVRGECNDDEHLDWIMVSTWNWSVNDPAALPKKNTEGGTAVPPTPAAVSGARGRGADDQGDSGNQKEVMPEIFTFSKQTDRSTTRLMTAMDGGMFFSSATLVIQEQFEAAPHPFYLEIKFEDAFLIGFNWSAAASGAGRTFDETWKMNYSRILFDYDWRGGKASILSSTFNRPADASSTAGKKAPLTKAESEELDRQKYLKFAKTGPTKSGR